VSSQYIFIPYNVVVVTGAIPGNGALITPFTLDQDGDFELHYIQGSCSLDDNTKYFQNNFSCQITDKSNSRIWGSDRTPQINLCGPWNAGLPERRPVLIARKTNLSFDVLNLKADPNTVTIILKGYKVRTP
jgi:hypothetical protein